MRILFVLPSFPELSETFILRQMTGLLDRGHDVHVLAQQPGIGLAHPQVQQYALLERTRYLSRGHAPQNQSAHHPEHRRPDLRTPTAAAAAQAAVLHTPRSNRKRPGYATTGWRVARAVRDALSLMPPGTPRKQLAALQRVGQLARETAPDVVHCHYGEMGLHFGFAAALWDVPLVVSFYGYDCSSYPASHGHDVYHRLFRRAPTVTALSDNMRRRLIDLGADAPQVRIQPLAVDTREFSYTPRQVGSGAAPTRLLSVARFVEKKGLEYAIRAFASVSTGQPLLEYEIIGDGPLRADLERLAASLGVAGRIRFRGRLAGPDIVRAMQDADIFVLPSVTAANGDEEGTPTVLLEAAACGLPVLSTWHAGIPEIVEHEVTGLLAPERDVDALAAGLRVLLADPDRRLHMGQAARRRVEACFDVPHIAERLEQTYAAALAARP